LNNTPNINFGFEQVSVEYVENIIDKLQPKNSSGDDGVSTKLIKYLKELISRPLTLLINQGLREGCFPDVLKTARVKSLFKKGDKRDPNNYRPISILPSVSKIFEKVMHKQIVSFFQTNNLFYESQYGFRAKHSTELAVLELVDRLGKSMDAGGIPLSIFIDLSKAFDCLNHAILLDKLAYYGFCESSLRMMKSYLSNRNQYVEASGFSSNLENISIGVPQGSILGPLLFLIYMNDLARATDHFHMINFADDTALVSTLQSSNNLEIQQTETELSKVSSWLEANKMLINVGKTKAMVFHTPRKSVPKPVIKLKGANIEIVDRFPYLGIILDKHLSWHEHVSSAAAKISKTIGVLNRLKHFLPPYTLKVIYDSLINCRIKYGILVWGASSASNRIFSLQKRAVRVLSKAKYNAHCDPLFKSLGILKLADDRKLQELKFYFKFKHGQLPLYFQNDFIVTMATSTNRQTRNANVILYPRFKHEYMRKNLRYSVAKTVNETPPTYREKVNTHSLDGFSNYIKLETLRSYQPNCTLRNCYVCNRSS
jgi:hypothetical protein